MHGFHAGLLVLLSLFFTPALFAHGGGDDHAPTPRAEKAENPVNPRADLWRQVREGERAYSAVKGVETNVYIENGGQNWRRLRNGPVATYGAAALIGTVAALAAFFAWRGPLRLNAPPSGVRIPRWSRLERAVHWVTTIAFLWLALTGLLLLFGRAALIPLIGHEKFSPLAEWAKLTHNYVGPLLFLPGLVWMIGLWLRPNLPNRVDWAWFKAFGGMIGDAHPSAGRMNGGEKAWFWLLTGTGLAVCASGLLLDFPFWMPFRELLQNAHLLHVGAALLLLAVTLGHIYIGSIGTEGALEGMTTGSVDETWVRQHHDLWLEEMREAERR
jgi:formate dehydrogenase subunit gamma